MLQRLLNKDRTGNAGTIDSGLYDIRRALAIAVPCVVEIPTTTTTTGLVRPHSHSNFGDRMSEV